MRLGAGEPHRDVCGLERLKDDAGKIAPYCIQVDGSAESPGERGHDCLGVVALPVEPSVDGVLNSLA